MATRSFTTDLTFNRKSADNSISALSGTDKFNRSKDVESNEIRSLETIKLMFAKGQNKRV